MEIRRKVIAYVSLTIIILYWCYQLFFNNSAKVLPPDFSDFVLTIAMKKTIQLVIVAILLRIAREPWSELGFHQENLGKQIWIGLLFGVAALFLLNVGLNNVLQQYFPRPMGGGSSLLHYFSDPSNLFAWIMIGIFGGGFVEELMRIFTLTRFQRLFGQPGLYFALLFSSFIFGLGHLYQGTGTAISTGISGLVMGTVYIRRGSAWEVIIMHAFSDVLAILAAFQLTMH